MARKELAGSARPLWKDVPVKDGRVQRVLVLADGEKIEVRKLLVELEPWLAGRVQSLRIEADVRGFHRQRQEAAGTSAARTPARPPPAGSSVAKSPAGETRAGGAPVVGSPELGAASLGAPSFRSGDRPDLVVVVGGDGAILAAVRAFSGDPVPTIGINFGRVGFLASVEAANWREALSEALEGRTIVEPRMRLEAELVPAASRGEAPVRAIALNDVVITRGAFQGMLSFALKIGEEWVTNYRADGLIVATPSGSTAYSLASGGPILAPKMQDMVVTPICPQALSHRALVLPTETALTLSITHASGITTMVVDGQGFFPMEQGDSVRLARHPVPYPLLARPGEDFYKRLRERLGWRGSNEPDVFPPQGDPSSRARTQGGAGEEGLL